MGSPTTSGITRVVSSNDIDVERRIVTDGRCDMGSPLQGQTVKEVRGQRKWPKKGMAKVKGTVFRVVFPM